VRTGKDAFTEKYGKPTYEYLREHPGENLLFDRSMSNLSDLGLAPILQVYNFSKYAVISDIGGGEGFLLANILQCNPGCRGILFDTPHALEKAPEMMNRYGVIDRTEIIAGDFFQSVPATGELTILKNIVHNWSDQKATGLLTVIHRSMKPGAVLLILEMVVPAGNEPSLAKLLDIQMMATMEGGKERTAAEYRELLENSGFTFRRIIPTISPVSLIEAVRK
jgi:hypothetical protein